MSSAFLFLAQTTSDGGSTAGSLIGALCGLIIAIIYIASLWVVFSKAGKPGWAAIIPIYNTIVLLEIIGRPIWWIILFFIPVVNFIVSIMMVFDLAKAFGKGTGFGCGLLLLPFIFFPILAFGDAQYQGPPN